MNFNGFFLQIPVFLSEISSYKKKNKKMHNCLRRRRIHSWLANWSKRFEQNRAVSNKVERKKLSGRLRPCYRWWRWFSWILPKVSLTHFYPLRVGMPMRFPILFTVTVKIQILCKIFFFFGLPPRGGTSSQLDVRARIINSHYEKYCKKKKKSYWLSRIVSEHITLRLVCEYFAIT